MQLVPNKFLAGPTESRPTPRAIRERLTKIKENAKVTTGLTQPSSSPRKGRKPTAKLGTPKKAGVKRKRVSSPTPISTEEEGEYGAEDTPEHESLDQRVKPSEASRDAEEEENESDGEA